MKIGKKIEFMTGIRNFNAKFYSKI